MNNIRPFTFPTTGTDVPTGVETSKVIHLQEKCGPHVIVSHTDTGTASVEHSPDNGTTWIPVEDEAGAPLVLTDDESAVIYTPNRLRVNNLTGTGKCWLNNPFYE